MPSAVHRKRSSIPPQTKHVQYKSSTLQSSPYAECDPKSKDCQRPEAGTNCVCLKKGEHFQMCQIKERMTLSLHNRLD